MTITITGLLFVFGAVLLSSRTTFSSSRWMALVLAEARISSTYYNMHAYIHTDMLHRSIHAYYIDKPNSIAYVRLNFLLFHY